MLSHYELLLVPTDVDNELLQQRYQHIRDIEDRWPNDAYYPMDVDFFQLVYETILSPAKRAAHDEEFNIVPQKAGFTTCQQWTPEELASKTTGRGKSPGPHFAHIGIANLLNGGQIDFINGFAIRRNRAKRRVLIQPDGELVKAKPPYRIPFPNYFVDIDRQHAVTVRRKRIKSEAPSWSYKWNAKAKGWFERPVFPSQSDQATSKPKTTVSTKTKPKTKPKAKAKPKTKPKPRSRPDSLPLVFQWSTEDVLAATSCPVCGARNDVGTPRCPECDTRHVRCMQCFRLFEFGLKSCPNCGTAIGRW